MTRQTRQNGATSRRLVVARALALTASDGPQAATIGALADALGMSKSGVFALFGSKEALDAAVVDAAAGHFGREVVHPAEAAPRGVARLAALVEGWLGEVEASGPALPILGLGARGLATQVRDRVRDWQKTWRDTLAGEVAEARRVGELDAGADPAQTAFEIDALLAAAARDANTGGPTSIAAARTAIENRLRQLAAGR